MKRCACFALLAAALLLIEQSCAYRYTYTTGLPESATTITAWKHHWVWGWVNPGCTVDLKKMSPTGVARFGSYESFGNWLCALVTIGFYAPETVYVVPPLVPQSGA